MSTAAGASVRRFPFAIAALVGLFIAVDALLLFGFFALAALTGGTLNPYLGVVMFVVLPLAAFSGSALCWWGCGHLGSSEPEYEVQGR